MAMIATALAGGVLKANASRRAAQAQAAQDEFNAKLDETAAGDALLRGQTAESAVHQVTSDRISTGKASLGASGVDTQSGSAVDALAGLRARGMLAALVLRGNAARDAWGFQGRAADFRARAQFALQSGDDAALGDMLGTGSQILGIAGKTGSFSGLSTPGVNTPLIRVGEPTTSPVNFGDASFGGP